MSLLKACASEIFAYISNLFFRIFENFLKFKCNYELRTMNRMKRSRNELVMLWHCQQKFSKRVERKFRYPWYDRWEWINLQYIFLHRWLPLSRFSLELTTSTFIVLYLLICEVNETSLLFVTCHAIHEWFIFSKFSHHRCRAFRSVVAQFFLNCHKRQVYFYSLLFCSLWDVDNCAKSNENILRKKNKIFNNMQKKTDLKYKKKLWNVYFKKSSISEHTHRNINYKPIL